MRVSLDGGLTSQEAPKGVRVYVDHVTIPERVNEDLDNQQGRLEFNFTEEGLIADLWVNFSPDDDPYSYSAAWLTDDFAELIVNR